MLPNREVHALNERGIDLPARGGQHPVDAGHGAEHHAVPHADHPSVVSSSHFEVLAGIGGLAISSPWSMKSKQMVPALKQEGRASGL